MQNSIRYIAIDDNPINLMILQEYSKQFPFFQFLGGFNTAHEGLESVKKNNPDLVFLDIEMPEKNGIEILKQIKGSVPIVVFITSHPEFALEGFELSAFDYILKPLTKERFTATANRLQEYWKMKQNAKEYQVRFEQQSLIIKEGHKQIKLQQNDIIYLEAMQDYTKVVTPQRNYLTLTSLTLFLEKMAADTFIRVHRSYAVAINKINEIHNDKLIVCNTTIPIGKTYRPIAAKFIK